MFNAYSVDELHSQIYQIYDYDMNEDQILRTKVLNQIIKELHRTVSVGNTNLHREIVKTINELQIVFPQS